MTKRYSVWQAWMLAIVLALGFGFAWAVVVLWACAVGAELAGQEVVYETLLIRSDGVPLIQRYLDGSYNTRQIVTLDGEELDDDNVQTLAGAYLAAPPATLGHAKYWWARIGSINDGSKPPVYWYCVHDGAPGGMGYFVGYDSLSKQRVGYCGSSGFRNELPPQQERFPIRLLSQQGIAQVITQAGGAREPMYYSGGLPSHFLSSGRVIEIDFKERSIETVAEDAQAFAVGEMWRSTHDPEERVDYYKAPFDIILRRNDSLVIVNTDEPSSTTFAIPEQLRGDYLSVYAQPDNRLLLLAWRDVADDLQQNHLYWVDTAGNIEEQQQVLLRQPYAPTLERRLLQPPTAIAAIPSPIALTVIALIAEPIVDLREGRAAAYPDAVRQSCAKWWPVCLLSFVVAGGLTVVAVRRHRRYALPAAWLWAVLALLGGPIGFLAYLVHRTWPARVPCPACGSETVVNRDTCTECSSDFPPPKHLGIEVVS